MKIKIQNQIHINEIPESLEQEIKTRLTMDNPAYKDAVKMNRWTNGIAPKIFCYQETKTGLIVPRGYIRPLAILAKQHGEKFEWTDNTRDLTPVDFQFKGTLRDYQEQAATAAMRRRFGVIQAPTGSGKTVMALYIIAERGQPVLIVVHSATLCQQWIERIHSFLDIPVDEIGIIGGGKMKIGNRITVGMVQTLHKCKGEVAPFIGNLVVDECHRTPSRTFTEAVSAFDSRYMLGLSATPYRRDGLTKLIHFYLGDQVAAVNQKELTDNGAILPFKVKWVETGFTTGLDPSSQYSAMLSELTQDPKRNAIVCQEAAQCAVAGKGIPLVISDRKAHCQAIAEGLERDHGITATILNGDLNRADREAVIKKLNAGDCQCLVATGALIGEGFDLPALGTVVLATPIKFKGRVIQSIGRALRPSPGQDMATVIDFMDVNIGILKHSAKKRMETYRSLGAGGC